MNKEEFTLVFKWFEYSQRFKSIIIQEPLYESYSKEYFLIDSKWIGEFKKIFHYENLKKLFHEYTKKYKNAYDDAFIASIYDQGKLLNYIPNISEEDKKKIKVIHNKKITNNILLNGLGLSYYKDFIILESDIFKLLEKVYVLEDKPKVNIYIGNNIFYIQLRDNAIELGIIISTYEYKYFILQTSSQKECNEELENIKKYGKDYFSKCKINIEKAQDTIIQINKNNGKTFYIINLNNGEDLSKNNINLNFQNNIIQNQIDISNKKSLINYDKVSSRLNSLIQILTSIKEIKDYLEKPNNYQKLNHIYILTSTFINIYKYLYNSNKGAPNQAYDLSELKIILDFIDEGDTNSKSLDKLLFFILEILHEELNTSEYKINNNISLVSFNSPFDTLDNSARTFSQYYQDYYKSIISDTFNWIREEKKTCTRCKSFLYSFQAFPFLEFDLDKTHEFIIFNQTEFKSKFNKKLNDEEKKKIKENYKKNKEDIPIHILNCFEYYSKNIESSNNESFCKNCNQMTQHSSNYFVYKSPNYFILILNRKNKKINIDIPEELNLETIKENNNKDNIYKLFAVMINTDNNTFEKHYISCIKNIENWKVFDDDKSYDVKTIDVLKIIKSNTARMVIYKLDN